MTRFSDLAKQEGRLWSGRARDWADIQEGFMSPCYNRVLDAAGIGKGTNLLDVGCGAGGFLRLAAHRGAQVSGLDAAPALVSIARERTPHGDFRIGDFESLPYQDDSFDVVTGFNSFQHGSDPVIGLSEAQRVTKPGSLVVVTVWGKPQDCQLGPVFETIRRLLHDDRGHNHEKWHTAAEDCNGVAAVSEEEVTLAAVMKEAALSPVLSEEVNCPIDYPDEATMLRGLMSPAPSVNAISDFGEEPVRTAVLEAMRPYRTNAGQYHLENTLIYMIGRKHTP